MPTGSLKSRLRKLEESLARVDRLRGETPAGMLLDWMRDDPARLMTQAGLTPDPWQAEVLRSSSKRTLLLCSRQAGKSTTAAALALRSALLEPPALVLLLSPTLRQSGELYRAKVLYLYDRLGRPVPPARETATELQLANGSRIISLPENESGVRGFSGVSLLVVDEASRVSDALYKAVRPMLAVSQGRLVCLTTPFGQQGWFHSEWEGPGDWSRVRITAPMCPRIPADFLAEERKALGERWYAQEYLCEFNDLVGAVFARSAVEAAMAEDVPPLFAGGYP